MDNLEYSSGRRPTDVVLFAVVFFSLLLSLTGVILDLPGLAFAAGGLAFICVLPFVIRT
jgi:hypothetical protein